MADWRDLLWRRFEADLFDVPSTDRLFNPYSDGHPEHDAPDAPRTRRENLRAALDAVTGAAPGGRPDVLVVGEAPGPWGARFTGVPFTNERQLLDLQFPLVGRPTSAQFAATGEPVREHSGAVYWDAMLPHWGRFWTWNALPLHPHRPGAPLTVRTPAGAEIHPWHGLLAATVEAVQPRAVLAVGRKAEGALDAIDAAPVYVRHPSQGGADLFRRGVAAFWKGMG